MNREEAVKLLKQIIESCTSIEGYYLALMPSGSESILSHGYQIHLKTYLSEADKKCIQGLITQNGLELREISEKTIIFKPQKNSKKI